MKNLFLFAISLSFLVACEEPVEIEIEGGESQLIVDAFLNDLPQEQVISLAQSKEFFDKNQQVPVLNADVKVTNSDGTVFQFLDANQDGLYTWSGGTIIEEGKTYNLTISYNGELYTSEELANPVAPIDSLVIGPQDDQFGGGADADTGAYQIELFARDLSGREDYNWIRSYRNDTLNTDAGSINAVEEAGSVGSDGTLFIPPVRFFRLNDFGRPYEFGETVKVQIWSINRNTFLFLNQVSNQINNGGLFAVPPSNVRTNIESSSQEISKQAVGYFSVSMVSEVEKVIQ